MPSSSPDPVTISIPRVGAVANVRNRRGLVTAVAPFGQPQVHLVTLEYLDSDGVPEDQLIWEVEPNARLLEPTALPDPSRDAPMLQDEFQALVRATRWTALTPYIDPDGAGPGEAHLRITRRPPSARAPKSAAVRFIRRKSESRGSRCKRRENSLVSSSRTSNSELLLTRQADVELFDGVRLEFLVFDEAHTYSGTTGAETASSSGDSEPFT